MVGHTGTARRSEASRGFARVLGLSLAIHGAAVGGVVFAQSRRPPPPPPVRAMPVELVRLGKPRDPKLLPRLAGGRPAAAAPGAVALDAPATAKVTDAAKAPRLSAAARRMLEAGSTAEPSSLDRALARIAEPPEGREDGSPRGTATDAASAASGYAALVAQALKEAYRLPDTIPAGQRQFLRARVVLKVERDGRVSAHEFVEAHPNQAFMGALATLLQGIRLPPPPPKLARQLATGGLEVVFKP
jgi:hypothetical protein